LQKACQAERAMICCLTSLVIASIVTANALGETIEGCLAIISIAEETDTDAFPIATSHGECIAYLAETDTIDAVGELVTICLTVVVDAQPEFLELSFRDDLTLALSLDEDAVFAETDTTESLATTKETSIAVALCGE